MEIKNSQEAVNKMALVSPYTPIITPNGLNFPIKKHRVAEWVEKRKENTTYQKQPNCKLFREDSL